MAETYKIEQNTMPMQLDYSLIIVNKDEQYLVDPVDGVKLSRGVNFKPSSLSFSVLNDDVLDFTEGNTVIFSVNGETVFHGFVFTKRRTKKETISVTCYDQMRYLKNKDCYVYGGITAAELLKMICDDYKLVTGDIANTVYKMPTSPQRIERDKTLMDIIKYAFDQTLINTPEHTVYQVYDDGGRITCKSIADMELDLYIDVDCLEDYSYESSIDKDTFNVVKVVRETKGAAGKKLVKTGEITDEEHVKEWGKLQYLYLPDEKDVNAMDRAKNIITLKNRKTRDIRLKNVIGDIRVRGGSMIYVNLDFGDILLNTSVMVEAVEHEFKNGSHFMDLDLLYVEKDRAYEVKYDNDKAVLEEIQKSNEKQGTSTATGTAAGTNSAQVDSAFAMNEGRVSPYGSVGCADTVAAAGSYYNKDLADAYNKGIASVPELRSDLESKGYVTETFNGYANKGDLLIYGDDDHIVIADGAGGCFGNSSSNGYAMKYGDANYAWGNNVPPTKIIRMG